MIPAYLIHALASAGVLTVETAGAAEPGLFTGTIGDALWTVVAFVLLMLILGKVAWRPLLAAIKAREDHVRAQVEAANKARQQAERLLEEYKQQAILIVQHAVDDAKAQQEHMLEQARQEVMAVHQKAKEDIEYAKGRAIERIWAEAHDLVSMVTAEVVGRSVTGDDNQRLIRETLDVVKRSKTGTAP